MVKMKPGVVGQGKCDSVTVVGSYAVSVGFFTTRVQRCLYTIEIMCAGLKCLNTKCRYMFTATIQKHIHTFCHIGGTLLGFLDS